MCWFVCWQYDDLTIQSYAGMQIICAGNQHPTIIVQPTIIVCRQRRTCRRCWYSHVFDVQSDVRVMSTVCMCILSCGYIMSSAIIRKMLYWNRNMQINKMTFYILWWVTIPLSSKTSCRCCQIFSEMWKISLRC